GGDGRAVRGAARQALGGGELADGQRPVRGRVGGHERAPVHAARFLAQAAGQAVAEARAEGVLGERAGGRVRLGGGTLPAIRHGRRGVLVGAGGEHSVRSFEKVLRRRIWWWTDPWMRGCVAARDP